MKYDFNGLVDAKLIDKLVGEALRSVRHDAGLSLDQLGKRLGVSPSNIGMWERADRRVSIPALVAVGLACEMPGHTVLTRAELVEDQLDLEQAILAHPRLSSDGRRALIVMARALEETY